MIESQGRRGVPRREFFAELLEPRLRLVPSCGGAQVPPRRVAVEALPAVREGARFVLHVVGGVEVRSRVFDSFAEAAGELAEALARGAEGVVRCEVLRVPRAPSAVN